MAMIHASMLDFARTGRLGPVHCGITRDELIDLLGAPDAWHASAPAMRVSNIWRYGGSTVAAGLVTT
jgi:hypothetical protein